MRSFTRVADIAELPDGTMKKVVVGEKEILIARSGNRYFVADGRCPHMNGDLSKGTLSGSVPPPPITVAAMGRMEKSRAKREIPANM